MSIAVYATAWIAGILFFCSRLHLPGVVRHCPSAASMLDRLGAVTLWIHIIAAYWLAHDGSHQAAIEHVAVRTEETIGFRNGMGIYANFATACVWSWLAFFATPTPASRVDRCAEIFLWSMWIFASVVFAQTASAWIFAVLALFVLATRIKRPTRAH